MATPAQMTIPGTEPRAGADAKTPDPLTTIGTSTPAGIAIPERIPVFEVEHDLDGVAAGDEGEGGLPVRERDVDALRGAADVVARTRRGEVAVRDGADLDVGDLDALREDELVAREQEIILVQAVGEGALELVAELDEKGHVAAVRDDAGVAPFAIGDIEGEKVAPLLHEGRAGVAGADEVERPRPLIGKAYECLRKAQFGGWRVGTAGWREAEPEDDVARGALGEAGVEL